MNLGWGTLTSAGDLDIFVATYTPWFGNTWRQAFGDTAIDWGTSIAADADGNLFITGLFHNTLDLGGGTLTSAGSEDIFLAKLGRRSVPLITSPIPDTTVTENDPPIDDYWDLNDVFTDKEDGTALSFRIEANTNPTLVTATIDADSALDLSFGTDQVGTSIIVVRATATDGDFAEDVFMVTVLITPRPDLMVSSLSVPSQITDASLEYPMSFTLSNVGLVDAGPFRASVYLSEDSVISVTDSAVTSVNLSALAAGADSSVALTSSMPKRPLGSVYLGVFVDDLDTVGENGESNNTLADSTSYQVPLINSVIDIPSDQGGQVFLSWYASPLDAVAAGGLITNYTLWRTIDVAPEASREGDGILISDLAEWQPDSKERVIHMEETAQGPVFWENIATHGAFHFDAYGMALPTLFDSTASSFDWHYWRVVAHTTDNLVFYVSATDSGYSVDNLAPSTPQNFNVSYNTGSGNQLAWDPSPEPDVQLYRIYRGASDGFTPDLANLVHSSATTGWTDPDYDGWDVYYKTTAVDDAGNESDPGSPGTVAAITKPELPKTFALYQNAPNPFNPTTTISYDVPASGGVVTLRIYDVTGKLIRTLVDGPQTAGQKAATWNGRDNLNRSAASGIYFYRLTAPGYEKTLKMLLLQ